MKTKENISGATRCPACNKVIDKLLAGAVTVGPAGLIHFCDDRCRTRYLERSVDSSLVDSPSADSSYEAEGVGEVASTRLSDRVEGTSQAGWDKKKKAVGSVPGANKGLVTAETTRADWEPGSPGLWKKVLVWLVAAVGAPVGWSVACDLLWPGTLVAHWSALLVVFGALGTTVWRRRRALPVGLGEAFSSHTPALMVWFAQWGSDPSALTGSVVVMILATIPLIVRVGLPLTRQRSGVAHSKWFTRLTEEGWRNNGTVVLRLERVGRWLGWIRLPLSLVAAVCWFLVSSGDWHAGLLVGASLLIVLTPGGWGLAVADAVLTVAVRAAKKGVKILDGANVVRLGKVQVALFIAEKSLIEPDVQLVDWVCFDSDNESSVLSLLAGLEQGVSNRIGRAILAYVDSRGASPSTVEAVFQPGGGVVGESSVGKVACGNRSLILSQGNSTALFEQHAEKIESSGRRVLFVVVGQEVVALFGIEEKVLSKVGETMRILQTNGVEPVVFTSAEIGAAQVLWNRVGVGHVQADSAPGALERLLDAFRSGGQQVVLVGAGDRFEAACREDVVSVATGSEGGHTLAGVDAHKATLPGVAQTVVDAVRAGRSGRRNLWLLSVGVGVGLPLAVGWRTPGMVLFLSVLMAALQVACTVNGPFVRVQRWLAFGRAAQKWVVHRIGLGRRG